MSEKKYQVFVSSTYEDLIDERQEVIQALLELDCFPAGMELFPAANEDQKTLIEQYIDDCDYYLVIVGGRYGSLHEGGQSYTELEYRYAVASKKPVIAFLHKTPEKLALDRSETSDDGKKKLAVFRDLLKTHMCSFWTSPEDLGGKVSRSMHKLMKAHPSDGWVRGNQVSEESARQMLRLKSQIEELESQLARTPTAPEGSQNLAQGAEQIQLDLTVGYYLSEIGSDKIYATFYVNESWDEIFRAISPHMQLASSEADLKGALAAAL